MVGPWWPERGDIVWLSFNPRVGHEQAGRRPALVLSPGYYNDRAGFALVCPITSVIKGYPFEVELPPDLDVQGVVLSDQLKSLDWRARKAVQAGSVPDSVMQEVTARVLVLVDPEE